MSRLAKLLRLRKWELEEKHRVMAELESRRTGLVSEIRRLEDGLAAEGAAARQSLEAASAFAAFAAAVRRRQDAIRQSMSELDVELDAARADNLLAFQEWKRVEVLHAREAEKRRAEYLRQEQMEMDELALRRHGAG